MTLLEMGEAEFEEAVFEATPGGLAAIGLAKVYVVGATYAEARARLVERLAFKAGHEALGIELAKATAAGEYAFIVEGLTGCTCHGTRRPVAFIE